MFDFLMEDITPHTDAEVGMVARTVHQGCKAVLNEHFHIEPISTAGEGASITVPVGDAADDFRLVGNLAGEAPFTGKLVHQGWRTTRSLAASISPSAWVMPLPASSARKRKASCSNAFAACSRCGKK